MTTKEDAVAADLLDAIATIADRHEMTHERVITAMFGCIVSAAVHGGVQRVDFLDLAGRLYEVINERQIS